MHSAPACLHALLAAALISASSSGKDLVVRLRPTRLSPRALFSGVSVDELGSGFSSQFPWGWEGFAACEGKGEWDL